MPLWLLAVAPAVVLTVSWLRWRSSERKTQELAARRALSDGELERAVEIFETLAGRRGSARGVSLWPALELARLQALRGDVDAAASWAADARQAMQRERAIDRATAEARLVLVDALITSRGGRLEEAWSALSRAWVGFEESHGGWLAEACLLRGFLAWKAGAGVETWLGLSDDNRARVRWMAAEWPELRAFIDAHDSPEPPPPKPN